MQGVEFKNQAAPGSVWGEKQHNNQKDNYLGGEKKKKMKK